MRPFLRTSVDLDCGDRGLDRFSGGEISWMVCGYLESALEESNVYTVAQKYLDLEFSMSDNFFIEIIFFSLTIAFYIAALNLFPSFVSEKIGNNIYSNITFSIL